MAWVSNNKRSSVILHFGELERMSVDQAKNFANIIARQKFEKTIEGDVDVASGS